MQQTERVRIWEEGKKRQTNEASERGRKARECCQIHIEEEGPRVKIQGEKIDERGRVGDMEGTFVPTVFSRGGSQGVRTEDNVFIRVQVSR